MTKRAKRVRRARVPKGKPWAGPEVEEPVVWDPAELMMLLPEKVTVPIEGREVTVQAWKYDVESPTGGTIPVLFLDTDCQENTAQDRELTDCLYGGDSLYRLKQEVVLGIGGVRMLRKLGVVAKKYHMNEGHASLLTVELLLRFKRDIEQVWDEHLVWDHDAVRELCVFTTHTPVAAGHDRFGYDIVERVLGDLIDVEVLKELQITRADAPGAYLPVLLELPEALDEDRTVRLQIVDVTLDDVHVIGAQATQGLLDPGHQLLHAVVL